MYIVYKEHLGIRYNDFRSASLEDCRNFIAARIASPFRRVRADAMLYKIEDRGGNSYPASIKREIRA
jgi:hypothetical protein